MYIQINDPALTKADINSGVVLDMDTLKKSKIFRPVDYVPDYSEIPHTPKNLSEFKNDLPDEADPVFAKSVAAKIIQADFDYLLKAKTNQQGYQTATDVSKLIADYFTAHPYVFTTGTKQLSLALAVGTTMAIPITFAKDLPSATWDYSPIFPIGATVVSVTDKTKSGCTLNIKSTVPLATGALITIIAAMQTP